MVKSIVVKDANSTNVSVRGVNDGTGNIFNQSIPTDSQGNVAAVVTNAQAARTTDGALVIAVSPNSPLPTGTNALGRVSVNGIADVSVQDNAAVSVRGGLVGLNAGTNAIGKLTANTDKLVIGAVSIADGSLVVGTHAVTQSGTWAVNAALTSTNNNVALTSVGTNPVAVGTGAAATALRVAVAPNTDKTVIGAVSIADASIPVAQSGTWNVNAALTSTNNNVAITSIGTAPVPVGTGAAATALRIALSPNADKTLVGLVSVGDGILANSGGTLAAQNLLVGAEVSTALPVFAAKVQAPLQLDTSGQLRVSKIPANTDKVVIGAVSIADGAGAGVPTKGVANTDKTVIGAVSIADTILGTIGLKAGSAQVGSVSVAGVVTVGSFTNVSSPAPTGAFFVGGKDPSGDLIGLAVDNTGAQRISGFMVTPTFVLTRPGDTTAYTANDLVANSTTLGSVNPLSWPVSRFNAGQSQGFSIRRARMKCSKTTTHRGHNFRLHLWNKGSNSVASNANVSVANADNGAFSASKAGYYLGAIDVSCDYLFTDGSGGVGSPNKGTEINVVTSATGQVSISGYLEVLTSLSPANAETFQIILEMFQD